MIIIYLFLLKFLFHFFNIRSKKEYNNTNRISVNIYFLKIFILRVVGAKSKVSEDFTVLDSRSNKNFLKTDQDSNKYNGDFRIVF